MPTLQTHESSRNVTGAIIFSAYVVSALFLTGFISRNLLLAHRTLIPSQKSLLGGNSALRRRLLICLPLCILSISNLSYHMLFFLVDSHRAWAEERGISLPSGNLGNDGVLTSLIGGGEREILVWQWLTTSTLFEDFARSICDDWARYWWTSQALVTTMGVNVWMGREGEGSLTSTAFFIFCCLVFLAHSCVVPVPCLLIHIIA